MAAIRLEYLAALDWNPHTLQKAGFIRYGRGSIEITDRPGLESVACECYGMVRRASDRLFGMAVGSRDTYRA